MQTLEPAAFISCLPLIVIIVLCVSFLSLLSSCFSLVSPVCNLFSVSFLLLVFSWCRLSPAPPSASWRLLSFVGRFSPNFVLSTLNFGTSPTENCQSRFISSSFLQVFFSFCLLTLFSWDQLSCLAKHLLVCYTRQQHEHHVVLEEGLKLEIETINFFGKYFPRLIITWKT